MTRWNSRGLRGSALEEILNYTNEEYRRKGLALIQKIPTPVTPVKMYKEHRQITLAYFEQKSTVDYIGAVQGFPVCFDAKECAGTTFPIANIHEHQVQFMESFEKQGGIAFLLIGFTSSGIYYYMRCCEMMKFWKRAEDGGRRSFLTDELDKSFFFEANGWSIPYLDLLKKDLEERSAE